jgi:hypothetical protein
MQKIELKGLIYFNYIGHDFFFEHILFITRFKNKKFLLLFWLNLTA